MRLLDRDMALRRAISNLSHGSTPGQINGHLSMEACGTAALWTILPTPRVVISHEAIDTWFYAHPKKTLIEHGLCLPFRRWMRKKSPNHSFSACDESIEAPLTLLTV